MSSFSTEISEGHVNINFKHSIHVHTYQVSWLTPEHFASFVTLRRILCAVYHITKFSSLVLSSKLKIVNNLILITCTDCCALRSGNL